MCITNKSLYKTKMTYRTMKKIKKIITVSDQLLNVKNIVITVNKTIQFIELLLIIINFVYNNKIDALNFKLKKKKKNTKIMLNMSVVKTLTNERCI